MPVHRFDQGPYRGGLRRLHHRRVVTATSPTNAIDATPASVTSLIEVARAVEIRPGDVVYIEPNEEHWHGATPDRFMAHIAMHEADEQGQVVTSLEHVTDADYTA